MDAEKVNEAVERISAMEERLDKALTVISNLEKATCAYEEYQSEIKILEDYYTSRQWKEDLELDRLGMLPPELKRGVLSEDGIYNMLERNSELQ